MVGELGPGPGRGAGSLRTWPEGSLPGGTFPARPSSGCRPLCPSLASDISSMNFHLQGGLIGPHGAVLSC